MLYLPVKWHPCTGALLQSRMKAVAAPTPVENAKLVLTIYKHFRKRSGEVLWAENFQTYVAANSLSQEDVKSGLVYGYENKWFEDGPNGTIKLTAEGFKEM